MKASKEQPEREQSYHLELFNACLSYRHDFGLLSYDEQTRVRDEVLWKIESGELSPLGQPVPGKVESPDYEYIPETRDGKEIGVVPIRKTEELVRKCFCSGLNYRIQFLSSNANATFALSQQEIMKMLSRAARRFVRMEQAQKAKERHEKFLRWHRKHPINEKDIKLPAYFGELD